MVVLSLFDGISCGQIAFERLGITFDGIKNKYIASEIKPIAIETTMLHYPNTIQVGDVCKLHYDYHTDALYANCDYHDNKYYNNLFIKISFEYIIPQLKGYVKNYF
jgi:site-specific DNA-cytosine methylase